MSSVVGYAFIPFLAAALGATIAVVRPPSARIQSYIQHFAAGVVFSIVAGELLPDLRRIHDVIEIVVGFSLGVVAMLAIRHIAERAGVGSGSETGVTDRGPRSRFPMGMFVATGVDIVVDGLLIGIGFAAGQQTGRLLVAALTIELLSLGLAVVVEFLEAGLSKLRAAILTTLLGGLLVPAAILGATLLRNVPESVLAVVLSFGAAALLFLVTEELLVEAHEVPETPLTTAMFFLGFLALFVVELVA